MKTKSIMIFFFTLLFLTLSGCSSQENSTNSTYQVITAAQAKAMMDENSDIIILDVRTEDEFATGHIKDAILIPDTDIAENAENTLTDKSSTILVYCRSGRRSALASEELSKLGYTNIYDFGGIIDWDYDVVTD